MKNLIKELRFTYIMLFLILSPFLIGLSPVAVVLFTNEINWLYLLTITIPLCITLLDINIEKLANINDK